MDIQPSLKNPVTLEPEEQYLWKGQANGNRRARPSAVRFLGYTSCPAVVIVVDSCGHNLRVGRDELFCLDQASGELPLAR